LEDKNYKFYDDVPKFSRWEMGYLLNLLWECEKNSPLDEVRMAILKTMMRADRMANYLVHISDLKKKVLREILEIFQCPLENVPLHINGVKHMKEIAKWRLEICV